MPAPLNYKHLYYFHVVATERSARGAALVLGVTQPTISEQLIGLERSLGVQLFERRSAGLQLTEPGRIAFEHTSVMFGAGDRLMRDLERYTKALPRTLRIGVSAKVVRSAARYLAALVALDCVPVIRTMDMQESFRDLLASHIDLVMCDELPPDRTELDVAFVEEAPLLAVAHPSLEAPADWSTLALVQYVAESDARARVESFLERRGLRPRVSVESDNEGVMLEIATRGGHVAFVSSAVAREAITSGRIRVLESLVQEQATLYAVSRRASSCELVRLALAAIAEVPRDAPG